MDPYLLLLRFVHIVLGVFWAGAFIFIATFLLPSVRDAGPDGMKVMAALQRRRFMDIMPVVAALTIVTGLLLYWRVTHGLIPEWVTSGYGLSLGVGGVTAIIAFAIGVGIMRPAQLRAGRIAQALEVTMDQATRTQQQAELAALRQRAATGARVVAALLAISVAGMAAARHLP